MKKIDIPKRSLQCARHGERFQPGRDIYSLLIDNGSEQLVRQDYCEECWAKVQDEAPQPGAQGHWKSKIEEKPVLVESSRLTKALHRLRSLLHSAEPKEAELFVLSLYLAHARQLVFRQELAREDGLYHVYEVLRQDEFVTVKVVHLSEEEVQTIQKTLAATL